MNKCCNNCKLNNKEARSSGRSIKYLCKELGEQLWRENWDTSKDYCSKWVEKISFRDSLYSCYIDDCNKNEIVTCSTGAFVYTYDYFKQRIEEVFSKREEIFIPQRRDEDISITYMREYRSAFDWILKEKL